jgi:hypothetical protein
LVTSGHVQIKKEDESRDNNTTVLPNNVTSSSSLKNHGKSRSQQIKDEVLDSFVQDAKVKQEGSAITLSHEERSNRKKEKKFRLLGENEYRSENWKRAVRLSSRLP